MRWGERTVELRTVSLAQSTKNTGELFVASASFLRELCVKLLASCPQEIQGLILRGKTALFPTRQSILVDLHVLEGHAMFKQDTACGPTGGADVSG